MGEAQRRTAMGLMPQMPKPGQQIQVHIDPNRDTQKACACGCKYFVPVVTVYTVSALVSPIGKELTAQLPVLICKDCGELFKVG